MFAVSRCSFSDLYFFLVGISHCLILLLQIDFEKEAERDILKYAGGGIRIFRPGAYYVFISVFLLLISIHICSTVN